MLQAKGATSRNPFAVAASVHREDGLKGLWRGTTPSMVSRLRGWRREAVGINSRLVRVTSTTVLERPVRMRPVMVGPQLDTHCVRKASLLFLEGGRLQGNWASLLFL